jgi:DNA-binding NtrC family response regulator
MQDAVRALEAAIAASSGVLVCGEAGSGRELFARAVHCGSGRRDEVAAEAILRRCMREVPGDRPFVSVDCAQRDGLEERLFGASAGFDDRPGTALDRIRAGSALHAALGGTLVLRQLPEMPLRLQVRLGRLLREGDVTVCEPGGAERLQQVAVRPVATSDLPDDELAPELRRRVAQAVIVVPPLRSRREDIPVLVRLLLADLCAAAGIPVKTVSNQALALLAALPWRGNVRELETLLRHLVRQVSGRHLRLAHVLAQVRLDGRADAPLYHGTLREAREQFERDYVRAVLDQHRGRMAEAAQALGLQRTNLYRKVRRLAVRRESPRPHLS